MQTTSIAPPLVAAPRFDAGFFRRAVWINCAVPGLLLGYDAWRGTLGVNGVNYALHTTGLCSLLFLVLSLTVTPLHRATGWSALVATRRPFGLYGFFYLCAHFLIFCIFDRGGSLASALHEILTRRYLQLGTVALILFVPLAVTSTDAMITRLGPRRWKQLHRVSYVATSLGAIHYLLLVKADLRQPLAFAGVLGGLLGYRAVARYRSLRKRPPKVVSATRPRFWSGQLRVARIFAESPEVRTLRLVPLEGTQLPFDYKPGQYLNLALEVDGKRVNRSYTIASSPTRTSYCELTVKRAGLASLHLHEAITEGSVLRVSAPAGSFTFSGEATEHVVLVAGGVGITPVMSMLRALTDRGWPGRIDLVYSSKTRDELVFEEELRYLAARFPNLHLHLTLTREPVSSAWPGLRGPINAELLNACVPGLAAAPIYSCGPEPLMLALRTLLPALGVPAEHLHEEAFVSPPDAPAGAPADQPDEAIGTERVVRFTRSGQEALLGEHETVLEAAETLGLELSFDCRSGICGQCKVQLKSGRVVMPVQDALTSADRKGRLILACQARVEGEVEIDA